MALDKTISNCTMFGMNINAVGLSDAARLIVVDSMAEECPFFVVTPNVDHIVTAYRSPNLNAIYQSARYVFADGMPLVWLSRFLPGKSLPERVTGSDLLYEICSYAAQNCASIAFVGGREGVAAKAAANAISRWPELVVKGVYSPPFGFDSSEDEIAKLISVCNEWRADIVCLGLGAPKQEVFAYNNYLKLNRGVFLCFGAAIDFMAGNVRRAPVFMRHCGLEWCWRLMMEPGRMWKRYLVKDICFFYLAFIELFTRWYVHLRN